MFLECLADEDQYSKAFSLKPPKIPLIRLLMKHLSHNYLITVLCRFKHHEIEAKDKKKSKWCCSLHMHVAKYINQPILDALLNVSDDRIILDFLLIYKRRINHKKRLELIIKLSEVGRLNKPIIKAIFTNNYQRKRGWDKAMLLGTLQHLQHRQELFIAMFRRLPSSMKSEVNLEENYLSIEPKWKWFLIAEDVGFNSDKFESLTLSLAYNNPFVPEGVERAHYFVKAYLKNVECFHRKRWCRAMNSLSRLGSGGKFDLESARLLYESDNAKRVLKVILGKGMIPYAKLDSQYHKYRAHKGIFRYLKLHSKLSLSKQLSILSGLCDSLKPQFSVVDLDSMLNGCISREFLPKIFSAHKKSLPSAIQNFCGLQVDSLSMENWRRLCFESGYFSLIIQQRSVAETKRLLEGMGMIKNPKDSTISNLRRIYGEVMSVEMLLREAFNPDIISTEFRKFLLVSPIISSGPFKMNLKYITRLPDHAVEDLESGN